MNKPICRKPKTKTDPDKYRAYSIVLNWGAVKNDYYINLLKIIFLKRVLMRNMTIFYL
ncbi:MAG: hypothetical protein ACTSRZ_05780 [Promethearchaeota archaeon]